MDKGGEIISECLDRNVRELDFKDLVDEVVKCDIEASASKNTASPSAFGIERNAGYISAVVAAISVYAGSRRSIVSIEELGGFRPFDRYGIEESLSAEGVEGLDGILSVGSTAASDEGTRKVCQDLGTTFSHTKLNAANVLLDTFEGAVFGRNL